LATKKGTTGTRRIRNSIDHWFSSIPSLIFLTTPSEPSSRAARRAPKLVCAARKIAVAPMVAAVMLKKRAGEGREEEPARQRGDGRARQREGDDQRVDGDEDGDGADVVGIAEGNQRLAVVGQGREAEVIAQEPPAEPAPTATARMGRYRKAGDLGVLAGWVTMSVMAALSRRGWQVDASWGPFGTGVSRGLTGR
jgi:hypothetical protein